MGGRGKRRVWWVVMVGGGVLAEELLFLYWPTLRWLTRQWFSNPYYTHGPLVPLVALVLAGKSVNQRSGKVAKRQGRGVIGICVLGSGLGMYLLGAARAAPFLEALSLIPVLLGLVVLLGEMAEVRRWLFPLLYLGFMIPLPGVEVVAARLQALTAGVAVGLAQLLGIAATHNGSQVALPGCSLVVGAPCSGMRSLIALLAVATAGAYLAQGSRWGRILLALAAVPLALLSNWARVTALLLVAATWGQAPALRFHELAGPVFFFAALGILMLVANCKLQIAHWQLATRDTQHVTRNTYPPITRYGLMVSLLLLVAIGERALGKARPHLSPCLHTYIVDTDYWYRTPWQREVSSPYDFSSGEGMAALPLTLGPWQGEDIAPDEETLTALQADYLLSRRYCRADGRCLWLTIIGSRQARSFHPPQICYGDWHTVMDGLSIPLSEGEVRALRLVAERGRERHVVVYFFMWPTPERDVEQGMVMFRGAVTDRAMSVEEATDMLREFIARCLRGTTRLPPRKLQQG